jgi:hypothetical protein
MLLKHALYLNFVFCLVDKPFRTPLALTISWLVHTKTVSTEMICSKILLNQPFSTQHLKPYTGSNGKVNGTEPVSLANERTVRRIDF